MFLGVVVETESAKTEGDIPATVTIVLMAKLEPA